MKAFPDHKPPDFAAFEAMASVQVSVLADVFDDRTYEETERAAAIEIFFDRISKSNQARQALKLYLRAYPATGEENGKAMLGLRLSGFNAPEETLSKEHRESIPAEVQRDAEWWEIQSQPQGATK